MTCGTGVTAEDDATSSHSGDSDDSGAVEDVMSLGGDDDTVSRDTAGNDKYDMTTDAADDAAM